jgi:arginase family enzyme
MRIRILDLDGGLSDQAILWRQRPLAVAARDWGPRIRLACRFGRFRAFETALAERLGSAVDTEPAVTFYGSGDFHHVSLALLRRLRGPFNLLVLDKHPDWMRHIPFLHCGTWLAHALELPNLRRVFHLGGDLDFDNGFRWLAPWPALRSGRVVVFPSHRRYRGGAWERVSHEPLRAAPETMIDAGRMEELLEPFWEELIRWPLYVSLDKDVMDAGDAVVNWDSGRLRYREVETILSTILDRSGVRLAGLDVVGDWSPVRVQGWFRRLFHWTEHPALNVDPAQARRCNQRTNGRLLAALAASKQMVGTI